MDNFSATALRLFLGATMIAPYCSFGAGTPARSSPHHFDPPRGFAWRLSIAEIAKGNFEARLLPLSR